MCVFLVPFTGPIHFGDQVELIYLAYLDLSFSSLSQTIPPYLFTYPELETLDLRNNQFSGVLKEFSNPSSTLAYVLLTGNRLSGPVPSSFSRLASLETLDISQNKLHGYAGALPILRPEEAHISVGI